MKPRGGWFPVFGIAITDGEKFIGLTRAELGAWLFFRSCQENLNKPLTRQYAEHRVGTADEIDRLIEVRLVDVLDDGRLTIHDIEENRLIARRPSDQPEATRLRQAKHRSEGNVTSSQDPVTSSHDAARDPGVGAGAGSGGGDGDGAGSSSPHESFEGPSTPDHFDRDGVPGTKGPGAPQEDPEGGPGETTFVVPYAHRDDDGWLRPKYASDVPQPDAMDPDEIFMDVTNGEFEVARYIKKLTGQEPEDVQVDWVYRLLRHHNGIVAKLNQDIHNSYHTADMPYQILWRLGRMLGVDLDASSKAVG